MQPGAKCQISAKSPFYISISAWSKSTQWLFHNPKEVAIPVLHAGKWPRPKHAWREGAGGHGRWTSASSDRDWGVSFSWGPGWLHAAVAVLPGLGVC